MNTFLWAIAIVLAVAFFAGGALKVVLPKEKVRAAGRVRGHDSAAWTEDFSPRAITMIGALEVLAAVGLVVPPLVGISPVLAPLAALGLVLMMIGAVFVHIRRKEHHHLAVNFAYLVLAAVVASGRFAVEPFTG